MFIQPINQEYTKEPLRLMSMCLALNIPFEMDRLLDGLIVYYPSEQECVCDAVCHCGSYGHEEGLLEILGLAKGEDVEGYLTAEEVVNRWHNHWLETHAQEGT